jgi:hypothetical protein
MHVVCISLGTPQEDEQFCQSRVREADVNISQRTVIVKLATRQEGESLRTNKVDRLVAEAVGVMNSFFGGSSDSSCSGCDSGGEEAEVRCSILRYQKHLT